MIGGAAVTEEIVPGFRVSIFSYVMSLLHPKVIARPRAARVRPRGAAGQRPVLPALERRLHRLQRRCREDPGQLRPLLARRTPRSIPPSTPTCRNPLKIVRQLLFETPVDPTRRDWSASSRRRRGSPGSTGRSAASSTARRPPHQSADDYLSQWFESDVIKAVFAYYASIGTFAGPKTPGLGLRRPAPPDGRARGCRRLGLHPRRHGHDHPGDRRVRPRAGLEIQTDAESRRSR